VSQHSAVIADGYDRISSTYLAWSSQSAGRQHVKHMALETLGSGSRILELGCGAGVPLTKALLSAGHHVTGIDISPGQIRAAKANLPDGNFHCTDLTRFDFGRAAYDAVVAAFTMGHVPEAEHGAIYQRIAQALRLGGILLASLCQAADSGSIERNWLGADMYFSHPSLDDSLRLIANAGLILRSRKDIAERYDGDTVFTWIAAEKER